MNKIRNCQISSIVKNDKKICSARIIFATVKDNNGNEYQVEWISGPVVRKTTGVWEHQETDEFIKAWEKAEVGTKVDLCHVGGNRNYFLISDY